MICSVRIASAMKSHSETGFMHSKTNRAQIRSQNAISLKWSKVQQVHFLKFMYFFLFFSVLRPDLCPVCFAFAIGSFRSLINTRGVENRKITKNAGQKFARKYSTN